MDRVDVGHGANPMRHADDFLYIVDGSHCVRGVANGYQLGPAGDFSRQVVHVQGAIPIMDLGHPDGDASFFQGQPGGVIGIVIETSHYDLIPGIEFTADRPAHGKGERGHVRTENYLFRMAAKKVRHGAASAGKHRVGTLAGSKGAVGVGIAASQIIGDSVDHGLWNLRPPGAIEKNHGMVVDGLRERRKLGADPGQIHQVGKLVSGCKGEVVGGHEQLVPRSVKVPIERVQST